MADQATKLKIVATRTPGGIQIGQDDTCDEILPEHPFQTCIVQIKANREIGHVRSLDFQVTKDPWLASIEQVDFEQQINLSIALPDVIAVLAFVGLKIVTVHGPGTVT